MVSFQVSAPPAGRALRFAVQEAGVLVAGSRFRTVAQEVCRGLVAGLGSQGFAFLAGCALGWTEASGKRCRRAGFPRAPWWPAPSAPGSAPCPATAWPPAGWCRRG
jgi:hypothetical protein